nr:hypothetical protein GCM10020093_116820 [Planobispora longispora]
MNNRRSTPSGDGRGRGRGGAPRGGDSRGGGSRGGFRADSRGFRSERRDDRGGYTPRRSRRICPRDDRGGYGSRDDRGGFRSERRDDRGGYALAMTAAATAPVTTAAGSVPSAVTIAAVMPLAMTAAARGAGTAGPRATTTVAGSVPSAVTTAAVTPRDDRGGSALAMTAAATAPVTTAAGSVPSAAMTVVATAPAMTAAGSVPSAVTTAVVMPLAMTAVATAPATTGTPGPRPPPRGAGRLPDPLRQDRPQGRDPDDRRQALRAVRPGPYRLEPRSGGEGRTSGRGEGRGRPGAIENDRFKTARQPMRDPDFYDSAYADERDTTEVPGGVRLQKVLAQAGVASRRACEEMIGEGRVTVDGQVVRRFGARVDPAKQVIHVDGKRLPTMPDLVYFAINKPIGVVSTMSDPEGRPSLADYVADRTERLFHVGRLDTETEGLILLTNDGELANRLTHPSYGVQKKYWAKVPGRIKPEVGRRLKKGIELEDGIAKADSFTLVQEHGQQSLVEIVLHEGRKHIVRRMLEEVGHPVIDLARIEFGPVKLGRLKPGTVRTLTVKEVGELYAAVGM